MLIICQSVLKPNPPNECSPTIVAMNIPTHSLPRSSSPIATSLDSSTLVGYGNGDHSSSNFRWYPYQRISSSKKHVDGGKQRSGYPHSDSWGGKRENSIMFVASVAPFSEKGNKVTGELCGKMRVLGSRLESVGRAILVVSANATRSTLRYVMERDMWYEGSTPSQYRHLKEFVRSLEDKFNTLSVVYNGLIPRYYDVCERVKILCMVCNRRNWSRCPTYPAASKEVLLKHGILGAKLADFTELLDEVCVMLEFAKEEEGSERSRMLNTDEQKEFLQRIRRYHSTLTKWEVLLTKNYQQVLASIEFFKSRAAC